MCFQTSSKAYFIKNYTKYDYTNELYCNANGRYSHRISQVEEDEDAIKWTAIQKLPTYDKLSNNIIQTFVEGGEQQLGKQILHNEVDVRKVDMME